MGIFSRIFRRKKKNYSHTIEISQLESWLDQESKELITKTKLDQELLNYINSIQSKRHEFETQILELEQNIASLPLDQQEETNTILIQTKKLLSLLTFTEPYTLKKSIEISLMFQKYLELTLKKIEESRFAQDPTFLITNADAQSLIHPLLQKVMELDGLRSSFDQKISQSGYRNFEVLYRKHQSLQECHHKHLQLNHHLQEKKDRLKFTQEKKEEKMAELSNLKQDPDYLALQEIYAKRQQLVEQLEENNDHIFLFFSKIKPALQFYKHQHPNSWLIDLYLEEPSTAISHDENLEILPILQQLEEQLTKDSDLLSPEDVEIFLQHLTKVHEGYIQSLQNEFYALKSELNQIDLSLKSRYFIFKIQESNYRVEHFSTQVEKLQEEISHIEDEINDTKDLKTREQQFLENTAKISLNKELNLTFNMIESKLISSTTPSSTFQIK